MHPKIRHRFQKPIHNVKEARPVGRYRPRPDQFSLHPEEIGGASRDRTDDLKLAKLALSQLSYGPIGTKAGKAVLAEQTLVGPGRFELPTPRLSSVCSNQLSYGPSPAAVADTGLAITSPLPCDPKITWRREVHGRETRTAMKPPFVLP